MRASFHGILPREVIARTQSRAPRPPGRGKFTRPDEKRRRLAYNFLRGIRQYPVDGDKGEIPRGGDRKMETRDDEGVIKRGRSEDA